MRAGLGAALVASLALTVALALGGQELPAGRAPGRAEEARALLDAARQASEIGDWASASACLDAAAAQDPGNSDILYMRALSAVKRGAPFSGALGDLDAALGANRFSSYTRLEAGTLKAGLLVRERRWREALNALGGTEGGASDPAYWLARAEALIGSGDERGFVAAIGDGLRRFPDDVSFPRLFLARAGKVRQTDAVRAICGTIVGRLGRYAKADPELPAIAAPLLPDISSRRDAVLAFRAAGGASPKASLRALEYGIVDEAEAAAELLDGSGTAALADLSSLYALAGSPAGREAVRSALASWKGEILVDADSDGVDEARFEIKESRKKK